MQIKNLVYTRRIRCFSAQLVMGEVCWHIWMDLIQCENLFLNYLCSLLVNDVNGFNIFFSS